MPFPEAQARFNRRVANPVIRPFAGRFGPLVIIEHRGRRSGRRYRTPVVAFTTTSGYAVALHYSASTDWVRNVLAAGGCALVHNSRRIQLTAPVVLDRAEGFALVPGPVRPLLELTGVHEVLTLERL